MRILSNTMKIQEMLGPLTRMMTRLGRCVDWEPHALTLFEGTGRDNLLFYKRVDGRVFGVRLFGRFLSGCHGSKWDPKSCGGQGYTHFTASEFLSIVVSIVSLFGMFDLTHGFDVYRV